jgi:hypothetical protein
MGTLFSPVCFGSAENTTHPRNTAKGGKEELLSYAASL